MFAIVNLATGEMMPVGGSKAEFSASKAPRLFARKVDALNAIACWKMGYWQNDIDQYGDGDGLVPCYGKWNEAIVERRAAINAEVREVRLEIL